MNIRTYTKIYYSNVLEQLFSIMLFKLSSVVLKLDQIDIQIMILVILFKFKDMNNMHVRIIK